MAPSSTFLCFILSAHLLLCSSRLKLSFAFEGTTETESIQSHQQQHQHTIRLSSLLPSSVCNPSTKGHYLIHFTFTFNISCSLNLIICSLLLKNFLAGNKFRILINTSVVKDYYRDARKLRSPFNQ